MDIRVQTILKQIKDSSIEIFKDILTGVYVHGSLALGCFNWAKSDIDFVVVTKSIPTLQQKECYIKALLTIDNNTPPKGLEMSLVLEKNTRNFVYPTPFELHFSNAHKEECLNNIEMYCNRMHGTDRDLAAHFTIIRKACILVCGTSEKEIFGEVPSSDYLDSIRFDIENAENEISINPVYIVLNLCRVLAFIQENLVISKKDGGFWGIGHLPKRYVEIISDALSCYLDDKPFDYKINESMLIDFAKYMHKQIHAQ